MKSVKSKLNELKHHLKPGEVYRRADLQQWSNAVDRHLKALLDDGVLTKLSAGLYLYPAETAFGPAPAEERALVQAFLKDKRFLVTSANDYNSLGLGTTQLYNETVVYNHKRHGRFVLGGREFDFRLKPDLPKTLTPEFLLVDLVNNRGSLAEDESLLLRRAGEKARLMNSQKLRDCLRRFGKVGTRKFFAEALEDPGLRHAA